METALLIIMPIATGACTIAAFFLARQSDARKQGKQEGAQQSDTEYIKRRVDDILLELKDANRTLAEHEQRLTRVEESSKSAHKRLDTIEGRLK